MAQGYGEASPVAMYPAGRNRKQPFDKHRMLRKAEVELPPANTERQ